MYNNSTGELIDLKKYMYNNTAAKGITLSKCLFSNKTDINFVFC